MQNFTLSPSATLNLTLTMNNLESWISIHFITSNQILDILLNFYDIANSVCLSVQFSLLVFNETTSLFRENVERESRIYLLHTAYSEKCTRIWMIWRGRRIQYLFYSSFRFSFSLPSPFIFSALCSFSRVYLHFYVICTSNIFIIMLYSCYFYSFDYIKNTRSTFIWLSLPLKISNTCTLIDIISSIQYPEQ